ncbi:hypothetical protein HAX54_043574, partial [Datura stramonium]|nr:hypothetical protein [Datura stramonium]
NNFKHSPNVKHFNISTHGQNYDRYNQTLGHIIHSSIWGDFDIFKRLIQWAQPASGLVVHRTSRSEGRPFVIKFHSRPVSTESLESVLTTFRGIIVSGISHEWIGFP